MNWNDPREIPWYIWLAVGVLLLTQATWLFLDARKRGARPWLWGLWGLIQVPVPLLVYWFVVIRPNRYR